MLNRMIARRLGWLLALPLLLAACGPTAEPPAPTRPPAPTFTPTPEIIPTPVDPAVAAAAATQAAQPAAPAPAQPPAQEPAPAAPAEPAPPTDTPTPAPPPAQPAEVVINANINVRGGPGTNYNLLGAANAGQRFPITGRNNDSSWWEINYNGQVGWVLAELVSAQNTQSVAVAANIPAPPPPPTPAPVPPTATPAPPPPQQPAPAPPAVDNFPYLLLEGVERCDPNEGNTYFTGYVRHKDNSPMNGVCVHIAFYEPRGTKCSGCDGVGDGNWGFSPFGGPAPAGVPIEIFVVPCEGAMPMGGQTAQSGFGNLTPQSKKWTRVINSSEQCTGITFVQR